MTVRPSLAGAVHLGAAWVVLPWLSLDAEAGVGGIPANRIHVIAGTEVWRRDAILLSFSLGLRARIPFVGLPL